MLHNVGYTFNFTAVLLVNNTHYIDEINVAVKRALIQLITETYVDFPPLFYS